MDARLEPRVNQIYAPLAAVVRDEATKAEIVAMARAGDQALQAERNASLEAQVLTVIRFLVEERQGNIAVKEIAELFAQAYGQDYEGHVTSRWIGGIVRRRLGLATQKSHGVFVVPLTERSKLEGLAELPEGAEYKSATMGDRGAEIQLATYGNMFAITR